MKHEQSQLTRMISVLVVAKQIHQFYSVLLTQRTSVISHPQIDPLYAISPTAADTQPQAIGEHHQKHLEQVLK